MKIRILYTGRRYETAEQVPGELDLPEGATVRDALQRLETHLGTEHALPGSCLVAVSGRHLGTVASRPAQALQDGDELVLIAPVAGG